MTLNFNGEVANHRVDVSGCDRVVLWVCNFSLSSQRELQANHFDLLLTDTAQVGLHAEAPASNIYVILHHILIFSQLPVSIFIRLAIGWDSN